MAVKENLAVLTVTFPGLDFSASYRTVTDVLRLAASLDKGSEHPLADAVVRALRPGLTHADIERMNRRFQA